MTIRPRIIPTLLIDEGNLVKTKQFKNPDYLGDPINAIKIFNEKGVDELCILDISATRQKHEPQMELLKKMASEAFMPLSYGGGITTISQMKEIFFAGYEKVVVNTCTFHNPGLITEASQYFGSQSIVAAIDYKKSWGKEKCYISNGRIKTDYSPIKMATEVQRLGAGEILLYSIERDGMRCGYDINIVNKVAQNVNIPVIACGGASSIKDIKRVLDAGADAASAGSLFVYFGELNAVLINFPEENTLVEAGIFQ